MSSHTKSTGPIPLSKPRHTAIADACQQHHVARLHDFGSLLRSDYRPSSWRTPTSVWSSSCTNSLGLAVDLVMASALRKPIVWADIETSKRLIYEA
jgi:predicted nucleotidyltransferase